MPVVVSSETPAAPPLLPHVHWDDEEWRGVLRKADHLPAVLQAIVVLDAWNELSVLHRAPWLGRLLVASILCRASIATGAHLTAVNLGLKPFPLIGAGTATAKSGCSLSRAAES
ncbi:hypothetical protein FHX05_005753 [Rhizobium sp. BK491]|nr:hypothetical protein [Rhizobium sp. BK491]